MDNNRFYLSGFSLKIWRSLGSKIFSSGSQVLYFGLQPFHLTRYSTLPFFILLRVILSAANTISPRLLSSIFSVVSSATSISHWIWSKHNKQLCLVSKLCKILILSQLPCSLRLVVPMCFVRFNWYSSDWRPQLLAAVSNTAGRVLGSLIS